MLTWVLLGGIGLVVLWLIFTFNTLVAARHRVNESWSDIDVQLKRRYDLIPNLVETVKGFAKQEKSVLENVTKARTQAMSAGSADKAQAENMLSDTLKSLFAVAENYPDLKSNQNFSQLQTDLTDTEDKIQASRRLYNGTVRDFNIKIEVFPTNLIAGLFGFKHHDFFEVETEAEKGNIKVDFGSEAK